MSESTHFNSYTPEQMDEIGKRLAQALRLRRDREYPQRWQTDWGIKTNIGIYLTLREMINRAENGETDEI